jgi:hypothetical protein
MLKITIQDSPRAVTMKLEGRIAGPWVEELDRTWRSLATSLGSKKLQLDLCDVVFLSAKSKELLGEIHNQTGAEFLADTPMTKYFAEAIGGNEAVKS